MVMPTHDSDSEWVPPFSVALRIWGNSTITTCWWGSSVNTQNSPYGYGTPPQWQEQWAFTAFSVTMTAQHPFAVALGVAIEHWGFAMINNSTTNHTEENWTWTPLFFLLLILYPPSTSTPAHHPCKPPYSSLIIHIISALISCQCHISHIPHSRTSMKANTDSILGFLHNR